MNYLNQAGSFECVVERPSDPKTWLQQTANGSDYIRIPLRVTSGPCKDQVTVYSGWLTEKAQDNTFARLKEVFGFDGNLRALVRGEATLAGLPCNITTEMETYENKPRCKVAWLNVPGGKAGGPAPLEESKLASILDRLTSRGMAVAKTVQGPATSAAAPSPAPAPGDDDVPF